MSPNLSSARATMSNARASSTGGRQSSRQAGSGDDPIVSPLFVDDIGDMVDYHRVRNLFAEHRKLRNVFVQRVRKLGRKFRFGFVRFFSRKDACKAVSVLNGTKLGGAVLRIRWAQSSLKAESGAIKDSKGAQVVRKWKPKGPSSVRSWRDVVDGEEAQIEHGGRHTGDGKAAAAGGDGRFACA